MYFDNLPEPPENIGSTQILKRLVDGLGFRYYLSTKDLTAVESNFRPVPSSMSIAEVNVHIFHLVRMTGKALQIETKTKVDFSSFHEVTEVVLEKLEVLSKGLGNLSEDELSKRSVHLKRLDKDFPFWYLINGFLADALTHIGQINSWRRMAGNPVSKVSPFTGKAF